VITKSSATQFFSFLSILTSCYEAISNRPNKGRNKIPRRPKGRTMGTGLQGARVIGLFGMAVGLAACGRTRPPDKADPVGTLLTQSSALINDQAAGAGKTGFIWIAPVVPTTPSGFTSLDQTGVANGLTVKVDRLFADNSTSAKTSAYDPKFVPGNRERTGGSRGRCRRRG
jgi:hypothetical protein